MNARPLLVVVLAISALEICGCKNLLKKRDPDAAPSAAPVAVAPSATVAPLPAAPPTPEPAPAQVAVDETAVPTSQDFEDDAFTKVTPANFRAQFAQLKTEVAKP